MMSLGQLRVVGLLAVVFCCADAIIAATVRIDYSTDTTAFFGAMNPQGNGAQAKAALDAAAAFYSSILDDTLAAIQTPSPFFGTQGGSSTWSWKRSFTDPATGFQNSQNGLVVPVNDYIVYVGARDLPTGELGRGGPGAGSWTQVVGGNLTSAESSTVAQIQAQFKSAVETRGETSGFARWGGAIAFDNNTNWHFDSTTTPASNEYDFYSVALHELGHTLGFGSSTEWNNYLSGATFVGPQAMDQYFQNGPVPAIGTGNNAGHWAAANTGSIVYGGTASQQSLMSPALPAGIRRRLTNLDAAALVDVGWEIELPQPLPGDYNGNGMVDASDYSIWRNSLGSTTDLRANGDNTGASAGKIDAADYVIWKVNYGRHIGSGAGGASGVPEPASFVMLLLATIISLAVRIRLGT
jgi:Matrixin